VAAGPGRAALLLFGDSITEYAHEHGGWAGILAHAYRRKADVVARGYSGYHSQQALELAPHILPSLPPLMLSTIFFGANDAAAPEPFRPADDPAKPSQHVPLAAYEANLAELAARVAGRTRPGGCVVLVSPPCVVEAEWPDRSNAAVRDYTAAAARAAATAAEAAAAAGNGVTILHLDLYAAFAGGGGGDAPALLLSDGLHLSPAGSARVAEALLALLAARAPGVLPDALPLDVPLWRDAAAGSGALAAPALAALRAAPFAMPPRPALPPGAAARAAAAAAVAAAVAAARQ